MFVSITPQSHRGLEKAKQSTCRPYPGHKTRIYLSINLGFRTIPSHNILLLVEPSQQGTQMIIKQAVATDRNIKTLQSLLEHTEGPSRQKIESELRLVHAGVKAEKEATYLIDFSFSKRKNSIVLHDLRLEKHGRVAQIDHLVITRFLEVFVLETKNFHTGLKITDDGEFLRWNGLKKTYEGMQSPVLQNERHIEVLKDVLQDLLPTRAGIKIRPKFFNLILVSSKARIIRPDKYDTSNVIKAEAFPKHFDDYIDESAKTFNPIAMVSDFSKVIGRETLISLGERLALLHTPISIDYEKKFGLTSKSRSTNTPSSVKALKNSANSQPSTASNQTATNVSTTKPSDQNSTARHPCSKCSSTNLEILYGKYGYYFKCLDCDGNTGIKTLCPVDPKHSAKLSKRGLEFSIICKECNSATLFFTNPTAKA